jgi:hypothetical protein
MQTEKRSEGRNLILFFTMTFAWSWLFWLPNVLGTAGKLALSGPLDFILGTIAVFGPSVAGFILSFGVMDLMGSANYGNAVGIFGSRKSGCCLHFS